MVERQVTLCGLASFTDREILRAAAFNDDAADTLIARAHTTAMLVSAAVEAIRSGLSRVVWPIHAGPAPEIDLDTLADICDRALLVSQLMTIDQPRVAVGRYGAGKPPTGNGTSGGGGAGSSSGEAIKIETPYADFTDGELLDVALDLDVPLAACWWCTSDESETPCGKCTECTRWRQALTSVDPQGLLDAESLWGAAPAR